MNNQGFRTSLITSDVFSTILFERVFYIVFLVNLYAPETSITTSKKTPRPTSVSSRLIVYTVLIGLDGTSWNFVERSVLGPISIVEISTPCTTVVR